MTATTYIPKSVFIDTNVLIDHLQMRSGHENADQILALGKNHTIRLCLSALSMADIVYIMRKTIDEKNIKNTFNDWIRHFIILPVAEISISDACRSGNPDFEDAMQLSCAEMEFCHAIITRNKKHFEPYTDIPVFTPEEFLGKIVRNP